MTVWIYIDTNKQVGDKDHLRVFANPDAAETWFQDRLTRSAGGEVIFAARIRPPLRRPRSHSASKLLSEMIPMTDKDMLFLAGLAGFAWWTYVFLPLVWFHS